MLWWLEGGGVGGGRGWRGGRLEEVMEEEVMEEEVMEEEVMEKGSFLARFS